MTRFMYVSLSFVCVFVLFFEGEKIKNGQGVEFNVFFSKVGKKGEIPSPHGDLRVVMRKTLVGRRTGPDHLNRFSLAPRNSSSHTFSKAFTLRLVKVIRILWIGASSNNKGQSNTYCELYLINFASIHGSVCLFFRLGPVVSPPFFVLSIVADITAKQPEQSDSPKFGVADMVCSVFCCNANLC